MNDDENDQNKQIIALTIEGERLTEDEQNILWLLLSFVAGNRLQAVATEHYSASAECAQIEYLNGVRFGDPTKHAPFDLRITETTFDPATFTILANGFTRLIAAGVPLGIALHHLHDANSGYIQVEIKNLLFCIHTLFEFWADQNDQRLIEREKPFSRLRRQLDSELIRLFGYDPELRQTVRNAIKYAYRRVGAVLQELFFDSLGASLSAREIDALRLRNPLFHSGYLVPRTGESQHDFYQRLVYQAGSLRTLAHETILKLAGYRGPFYDYGTWRERWCFNDDPAGPAPATEDERRRSTGDPTA